jgi:hypothetical protein
LNNTITAQNLIKRLPLEATVFRWGDEIFFETGVETSVEDVTLDVDVGDLAFWPEGRCLCLFFGRTPASVMDKPVAEKPVVIIGKALVDPLELRQIQAGDKINVALAQGEAGGASVGQPVRKSATEYPAERKLSQAEIDELVKKLLAERKK